MRQRGFTLVSAIFLLVVIAALGSFAVTVSTTQHQSSALDIEGARAYQAARAGIEWGVFQVLRHPAGIACSAAGALNAVTLPVEAATLKPFSVSVVCQTFSYDSETIFQLTSTASKNGTAVGSASYVERQITVTVGN